MTKEQALALAAARKRLQQSAAQKVENDAITQGAKNFNADASFLDNALAGAGKAVSDIGLGARQIYANVADTVAPRSRNLSSLITGADNSRSAEIQKEVDETKQRDAALMDTAGGVVGNVAGNVAIAALPGLGAAGVGRAAAMPAVQAGGRALLASPATLGGAAMQGGLGAVQAGLQPIATGESRGMNAAVGAAGGAIVPAAGMALKSARAAVEPLYEGGRQRILARALREASGSNAPAVIQNLKNASSLIPGSEPTAAEVANSGGIAAIQRAAAQVDPEAYATRAAQQNEARVAALMDLTGSGGQREFFDASRRQAADDLYKRAYEKGVDIRRHPETGQFLPKAEIAGVKGEITKLMQRPAIQEAMQQARTLAANEGVNLKDAAGSVKGLDYIKRALDDKISASSGNEQRVLVDLKNRLLTTLDRLSPDYAQARVTFAEMSKPLNEMDTIQRIADKSIDKLTGKIQPQAFARALSDDTAAAATGFGKATLENTVDPQKLSLLNALRGDLARSVAARDLGRGAGSDTVQKLAMTNLMQQSGIPVGVLNIPGVGRLGNFAYSVADDKMKAALAQALLNPKETAAIMEKAIPSAAAKKMSLALRASLTPVAVGSTPALLDVGQ